MSGNHQSTERSPINIRKDLLDRIGKMADDARWPKAHVLDKILELALPRIRLKQVVEVEFVEYVTAGPKEEIIALPPPPIPLPDETLSETGQRLLNLIREHDGPMITAQLRKAYTERYDSNPGNVNSYVTTFASRGSVRLLPRNGNLITFEAITNP